MSAREPLLILASAEELPPEEHVWGRPNRELPPDRREALDWLLLCRFLGWRAELARGPLSEELCAGRRCVIVARDSDRLDASEVSALAQVLAEHPVLVVARAAGAGSPLARLAGVEPGAPRPVSAPPRWAGPGPAARWVSHLELELPTVSLSSGCVPWAFAGSAPLVLARQVGRGTLATVAAHPSELRDNSRSGTGMLKTLLVWGPSPAVAWLDLDRSLVLRMDDPGSAGNAHLRSWAHRPLTEAEWSAIAADLAHRDARMSIGYVPGWIDDGDEANGELTVGGERVERAAARIHPSPLVRYRAASDDDRLHDHEAEYRGIRSLLEAGAGNVELHGHTHVRDHGEWVGAPDRYEEVSWYRELETLETGDGNPLTPGLDVMERFFHATPSSLLCPGQACSPAAAERALDSGMALVATETLALRDGEHLCWDSHVSSPGLGWPNPALLESGLPLIACFHDSDPVEHGAGWIANRLDEWRAAGARRLIDFRELAAALDARVEMIEEGGEPRLDVSGWIDSGAPRALPVAFRGGSDPPPTRLATLLDGSPVELVAERTAGGADRVMVPAIVHFPA